MVKDRLGEVDCKENGWLLDGFPRTGAQAEALVDIGVSPDYVLLLDVPDEQLIKRVVSPPPALYFFFRSPSVFSNTAIPGGRDATRGRDRSDTCEA